MKKALVGVVGIIVAVLVLLPLGMGFWIDRHYRSDIVFPNSAGRLEISNIESSLFASKVTGNIKTAANDRTELVFEQAFSYGWHFYDSFPFVAPIKSVDVVRLTQKGILKDDVLISGETYIFPFFNANGKYVIPLEIDTDHTFLEARPVDIGVTYSFISGRYDMHMNAPHIQVKEEAEGFHLLIEEGKLTSNGYFPLSYTEPSAATFTLKDFKMMVAGTDTQVSNLQIASSNDCGMALCDNGVSVNIDRLAQSNLDIALDKLFFNFAIIKMDKEILKRVGELMLQSPDFEKMQLLLQDTIDIFDKGAKLQIDLGFEDNKKAFNANAELTTDKDVPFEFTGPFRAEKFIIDVDMSFYKEIVDHLFAAYSDVVETLVELEYITKEANGKLVVNIEFQGGNATINGKPIEGFFAVINDESGYDEDEYEEYDDTQDMDD
jgi:hypothetical protein